MKKSLKRHNNLAYKKLQEQRYFITIAGIPLKNEYVNKNGVLKKLKKFFEEMIKNPKK